MPNVPIQASTLRIVAIAALSTMKSPDRWCHNVVATTHDDTPINVFRRVAVKYSEIGHIYKATQICYRFPEEPSEKQVGLADRITRLLDAQIRFINKRVLATGEVEYFRLMTASRQQLIDSMRRVIIRLNGGDKMLVDPKDVGVMPEVARADSPAALIANAARLNELTAYLRSLGQVA